MRQSWGRAAQARITRGNSALLTLIHYVREIESQIAKCGFSVVGMVGMPTTLNEVDRYTE